MAGIHSPCAVILIRLKDKSLLTNRGYLCRMSQAVGSNQMITMMETMITIIIRMTTMILLYDDNDNNDDKNEHDDNCLLYTSPSPRD